MFDADFLNGILNNAETSVEDKVNLIITEHQASERGLVQKKEELLGNEKKLKERLNAYSESEKSYTEKIANLESELAKNSPEEHKKYYDTQLAQKQKEFDEKYNEVVSQRDFYKTSHLKRLQDDAIAEGIAGIQFMDGLKDGFIYTVLAKNNFEPKDIDGKTIFLNKENKSIQDVMKAFALTTEGKAYIKNPTSGGGATGGIVSAGGSNVWTRKQYEDATPLERQQFFAKGGKLV